MNTFNVGEIVFFDNKSGVVLKVQGQHCKVLCGNTMVWVHFMNLWHKFVDYSI